METGYQQPGQFLFGGHGVHRFNFVHIFAGQKFVVHGHQFVGNRHKFAEHIARFVVKTHIVAIRFGHFFHSVQAH